MKNPNINDLTASDRIVLTIIWIMVGFIVGLLIMLYAELGEPSLWGFFKYPLLCAILFGLIGAFKPRILESLLKAILKAF